MKGCQCVIQSIVLADDEEVPYRLLAGQPHSLVYMPVSLRLRAEGAKWILPRSELPASLPKDADRRGVFQIRPTYEYLSVHCGGEYLSVRRTTLNPPTQLRCMLLKVGPSTLLSQKRTQLRCCKTLAGLLRDDF